ncbi:MAG: hypothetical protein GY711_20895 [bacterium]|nr:hypothetical protein [bacterium]
MTSSLVSRAFLAALVAAPLASTGFGAQQFAPVSTDDVAPDSGGSSGTLFRPGQDANDSQFLPSPPPLDQIPPLPMPISDPAQPPSLDRGMTFHDALSGETRVLPSGPPAAPGAVQSPYGGYPGLGAEWDEELLDSFGVMSPAGSLDSFPRSANVKLAMRFTAQNGVQYWFVCSGSMQDPGVVLAAGHCVYMRTFVDGSGSTINVFAWADIIYVYPGWDGDGAITPPNGSVAYDNWGYAFGTSYLAGSDWINNGNFDRDLGLIRITRGSSRNIGMLTGWYGWAHGGDCGVVQGLGYHNFSYPAEPCGGGLHTGRTMYYWNGTVDSCPGNQFRINTPGNCLDSVWGGMSGSAMYYIDGSSRYAHAACSNGAINHSFGQYCRLWGQFVTDMETFEATTRGTGEDWEPLRFRARGSTFVQAGSAMNDLCDVAMVNATNANPPTRDYRLRVYLSTNNNISEFDTLLATWDYNQYDFGAMASVNFQVPAPQIPCNTPPGTYWIGVIADAGLPGTDLNDDTDTWDAQQVTVLPGPGCPVGSTYCSPANPNSTGVPAQIAATGSSAVSSNDVTLRATSMPPGQFGYFLVGSNQGAVMPPGSQGFLCLTCGFQGCSGIGRYDEVSEVFSGPTGTLAIDLTSLPLFPSVPVQPGETWNFQAWYRDNGSSNFTDAVSIFFQ